MSKKTVTQYMRDQIAALDVEGIVEFVNKTKFTAEARKAILKRLGEIDSDPRTTPAEIQKTEAAREVVVAAPDVKPEAEPKPALDVKPTPKQPQLPFEKNRLGWKLWI